MSCFNSSSDFITFDIRYNNYNALIFSIYRYEGIYTTVIAISGIEKMSDYELAKRLNTLVKLESQIKSYINRFRSLIFTSVYNKSVEIYQTIEGVDVIDEIGRNNKIKRFEKVEYSSDYMGKAVIDMEPYWRDDSKLSAHAFTSSVEGAESRFILSETSKYLDIRGMREKTEIVNEITKGIPLACNVFLEKFCKSKN